ncbi:MAG: hypothetical protein AAGE01_14870 [Pseudomonadota bacterium]
MHRFLIALMITTLGLSTASAENSEGIAVRGHWTIEVLSPDGERVSRHEFTNALVGASVLTAVLVDDAVSGGLYVLLTNQNAGSSGMGPCNPDCEIAESGADIGGTPDSTSLTATVTGTNFETIRLAGNVTIANTSTIDIVQTWNLLCGGTNTPSQCKASSDSLILLTSKTLSTAINVTAGQIVQVQVDLTFSS